MSLPGGIRTKLALGMLVVVGGALGAAFLIVVPSLEQRLVDAKVDAIEPNALSLASRVPRVSPFEWSEYAETVATILNTRVVIFDQLSTNPVVLAVQADSAGRSDAALEQDPVAIDAIERGRPSRGRVLRGDQEYVELAVPLSSGQTVLFSASLADALSTVELVRRRLLAATVAGLAIAFGLGGLAAGIHARRIRRLERAANRIAEGRFDEPVVDDGADELGQLAAAFDRMRLQLAQLDTARKEFVANASHELRTPLFSLGGFLELLADEDLDEETRARFLATMREQVDRLGRLTADLLDLSRMDAGRLHVERVEVDLGDIARTLVDELRGLAEQSGHGLVLERADEALAVADEERVLQIGRALAGNALLHTPAGARVRLRTSTLGGRALLAVEDDGPGIPGQHLERIFDRFYRVEGAHASGSGLGLAIAHELADRMGGELVVQSRPGRTVFTLELPAAAPVPLAFAPA